MTNATNTYPNEIDIDSIMDNLAARTVNGSIRWRGSAMNMVNAFLTGNVTYEYRPVVETDQVEHYEFCRFTYNMRDCSYTFFYRASDNSFEVEETYPLYNSHAANLYQAIRK